MQYPLAELKDLFVRDLLRLEKEINAFSNTENIWKASEGVTNSAGNLCLHLAGNLRHFIGATLGQDGYVRDRNREFTAKGVSVEDLLADVAEARKAIEATLPAISQSDLKEAYPIKVFGEPMSTGFFLQHLAGHLSYHLGQINYLRRILEKQ